MLGVFFFLCSIVGFLSVHRLWKDRQVCGVSVIPAFVYSATNFFEVVYFWKTMPYTAACASLMFTGNVMWLALVFLFRHRENAPCPYAEAVANHSFA